MGQQQVFISYAWGGESELVANELEAALSSASIQLVRDKTDLGFKGLIREFMQRIGEGNLVILIISDKYLKSKNCMFELLEVAKNGEFHNRVFPIVLGDADIYDSLALIRYLKYWDEKIKALNASVKELDNLADTRKVQEDINLYTDIRGAIDDLAGKIGNMNTLTLEIMRAKKYQPLLQALGEKLSPSTPATPSRKEGKVLYHIPAMMRVSAWTRCIVRLAWEEILLTEGLKIPKEQQVIESIRLANVMQVSLGEGRDGDNFEIKALNNEEQFIFEDDFTEWLFDVKPLSQGNFTLILRVTLIQLVEGREKKKDIVLEREVATETHAPKALPKFETAESGLPTPEQALEDSIYPELAGELDEDEADKSSAPPFSPQAVPRSATTPAPPESFENRPSKSASPSPTLRKIPVFKRLMPYAASLVGILFVGYVGYLVIVPDNGAESVDEYTSAAPDSSTDGTGLPALPFEEEKMMVSFSLDATDPTGANIKEVYIFPVEAINMDSLSLMDIEGFGIKLIPASDTLSLDATVIRDLSFQEINDTMKAITKKPVRVGNRMIERKNLKVNPDN